MVIGELTLLLMILLLFRGDLFCWWRKPKYSVKTTNLPQ